MNETIVFSNPNCKRTGFLSNSSFYSFILEDKIWPTVEHYCAAKRFEGTLYEDVIRKLPTIYQVRNYSKAKTTIKGERVFGKGKYRNENIHENTKWISSYKKYLDDSIFAKFDQNKTIRKKLIKTRGFSLIDQKCKFTGKILENVRKIFVKNMKPRKKRVIHIKDFPTRYDNSHAIKYKKLIDIEQSIASLHGKKTFTKEMIADLIFNITASRKVGYFLEDFLETMLTTPFTKLYTDLPTYIAFYRKMMDVNKDKFSKERSFIVLWMSHTDKWSFPENIKLDTN